MFSKYCPAFLICLFVPSMCPAADDADFNRDLLHTVAARRALLHDKELAPLNLGVKVRNRVATLWGTTPSRELARRAYEVLRKLPDLIEVRDEMQIEPSADRPLFLPDVVPERLRPPPLPLPPPPGPPGILAKRPMPDAPKTTLQADPIAWQPVQMGRKDPRIPDDREIDVVISATLPVPPPPAETGAPKPLPQALHELQRDKRFSHIHIDMKGDTVYLRSYAGQAQGIFELARIISQLAGVQHVVVKEN
jgi:hypothetical protein